MTTDYSPKLRLAAARAAAREKARQETFWDFVGRAKVLDEANRREVPFDIPPYIEKRFTAWLDGDSEAILKARQMYFSWALAAYAAYVAKQPHTQVLMLSSGEFYAKKLLEKVKYIMASTGVPVGAQNASEVHVRGGGTIYALPSTEDAGRGLTASVVIVDEAAFHPYAEQNSKAYMPAVLDGSAQVILVSTSNGPNGFFYDMWDQAEAKGFRAVFEPWWVRPGRDEDWEARARAMMSKEDFQREYPAKPEEAWQLTQGLVYGDSFSEERHIREGRPTSWASCRYTYAAYDLGGGDPTAVVIAGAYKDAQSQWHVHVYDIYWRREGAPTVDELYAFIAPWEPYKTVCDAVPGGETIARSLEAMGLMCEMANNRRDGINTVKFFLQQNMLTISESVSAQIVREFKSYRYLERKDQQTGTRYATSTPADHHGDILDALRYLLLAAYVDLWNADGGPEAYSAVRW